MDFLNFLRNIHLFNSIDTTESDFVTCRPTVIFIEILVLY